MFNHTTLEAGEYGHPLFYSTNIEPGNVHDVITTIGLTTDKRWADSIGKSGWSSSFIHFRRDRNSIPVSLGKVVFHNGRLSHVKWYCEPNIDDEHGAYYYRLVVYLSSGVVMTDYQFDAFRKVFKRELSKVVEARRQRAKEEKLAKIRKRRRRATKNFGAVGANDSRRDISNNSQAPTTTCAGVNSQTALNSTLVTWLFKGYATS